MDAEGGQKGISPAKRDGGSRSQANVRKARKIEGEVRQMVEWRVGDECYYEFKAGTVKRVESDGRVTQLSDGCGVLCGHDLRGTMQPLEMRVAALNAEFEGYYRQISNANCGLNIPDIFPWLVQRWMEACNGKSIKRIRCRIEKLKALVARSCDIEFEGIPIFR